MTRYKQIVRISNKVLIYDSPGVVPFDHPDINLQAFLGAYEIGKLPDPIHTAHFCLDRIKQNYFKGFIEKYNLPSEKLSNEEIIDYIANKRGLILKGGKLNHDEAAKVIMREFAAGKIPYWEKIS